MWFMAAGQEVGAAWASLVLGGLGKPWKAAWRLVALEWAQRESLHQPALSLGPQEPPGETVLASFSFPPLPQKEGFPVHAGVWGVGGRMTGVM